MSFIKILVSQGLLLLLQSIQGNLNMQSSQLRLSKYSHLGIRIPLLSLQGPAYGGLLEGHYS